MDKLHLANLLENAALQLRTQSGDANAIELLVRVSSITKFTADRLQVELNRQLDSVEFISNK